MRSATLWTPSKIAWSNLLRDGLDRYPAEVGAVVRGAEASCAAAGRRLIAEHDSVSGTAAPGHGRIDLNGDGKPDYLIDQGGLICGPLSLETDKSWKGICGANCQLVGIVSRREGG